MNTFYNQLSQPSQPISNDNELNMALSVIEKMMNKHLTYEEENYLCFLEILVNDYEEHQNSKELSYYEMIDY